MFERWHIPIYYGNGHIGKADEAAAIMIASGLNFGAKLSDEDQRYYERLNEMAKNPRGRNKQVSTQALKLMEALTFVSVASRDNGEGDWQEHAQFKSIGEQGWVVTFDGLIGAGFPVEERLDCSPHTAKLKTAISKAGSSLGITLLETNRLSIKGDKLRALVPCLVAASLPSFEPDPPVAPLTEAMKTALACVGTLVSEGEDEMIKAAIMIDGGVAMSTNRAVALQYWHGLDFPPKVVIPKLFAQAVCRQNMALRDFGVSWRQVGEGEWQVASLTFYFENGAWIKSLCYADPYPNFDAFMNVQSYPTEIPAGLFEACETVAPFSNEGDEVFFVEGKVRSHPTDEEGAQYDVPGLSGNKQFDPGLLKKIAPFAKTMDIVTYPDRMLFFGDNVRGVCMGRL